jgi:hypothetical protein
VIIEPQPSVGAFPPRRQNDKGPLVETSGPSSTEVGLR